MMWVNRYRYLLYMMPLLLLGCDYGNGYRIEGGKVVYERPWNAGHGTTVNVIDADVATFEILGKDNMLWAKDKNHVFIGGVKLNFLDPKSFVVIKGLYAKDNTTVACDYKPIVEADVTTFTVKTYQYKKGNREVDLGVDKNAAYECYDGRYSYMPVDSIDTFELLYDSFYKDKNHVYWWGERIPLNVNKLRLLKGLYIADDKQVFYTDKLVKGADAASFKVISKRRGKDKNHKYKGEERVKD